MRKIIGCLPILTLLGVAFYTQQHYQQLPISWQNLFEYMPYILATLAAVVSYHFNRSTVFFYMLLIIHNYVLFTQGWSESRLALSLQTCLIPIVLLVFSLLPERGILSLRAIPAYIVLLGGMALSVWIVQQKPPKLIFYLMHNWLPARYFDWTHMPQTVLAGSVLVGLFMLLIVAVKKQTHLLTGAGILVLLFAQLYGEHDVRSVQVFSCAALLMCLYAVMQESWRMAYLDELTELPGRRALREKFQAISGLYSVAMLDVDHFKKFNDTYGHDTGDAVLRMIAAKMQKVSGSGVSYRYGGEEFTVLFNGKDTQQAKSHLEDLRRTIADSPFVVNRQDRRKGKAGKNKTVQVTVSIGVADSKTKTKSPWAVMKLADKALYKAKKRGRNQVCE